MFELLFINLHAAVETLHKMFSDIVQCIAASLVIVVIIRVVLHNGG